MTRAESLFSAFRLSPSPFKKMTVISSHVLDSVLGDHAKYIRIACFRVVGDGRVPLFDIIANDEGRIAEPVTFKTATATATAEQSQLELVFHSAAYFAARPMVPEPPQIMPEVVVRFNVPQGADRIHIPIMLSPHSYSIWWSA